MKGKLIYAAIIIAMLGFPFVLMYGTRGFYSAIVQHQLITPKEGVECVVVSTMDGVSVNCWKI